MSDFSNSTIETFNNQPKSYLFIQNSKMFVNIHTTAESHQTNGTVEISHEGFRKGKYQHNYKAMQLRPMYGGITLSKSLKYFTLNIVCYSHINVHV